MLSNSLSTDPTEPLEHILVDPDPDGSPCPEVLRDRVMVDAIHDGNHVPAHFMIDADQVPIDRAGLEERFRRERDWGAELVARCLASALHVPGYWRVNTARVLLDFGRFPGITPKSADHMNRFAINYPFSERLSHAQKTDLLENQYDRISEGMDRAIRDKQLKVAIHTYDERSPSASRRPAVSILTRSHGHAQGFGIPVQLYDPAFPHELAEFTADRLLRARIGLTLEEAAVRVAHNYPYSLPEGSVEVRAQVWFFFDWVRRHYEAIHPTAAGSPREMVWDMLMDTNLRSAQSETLRSYLHMYRKPPGGVRQRFRDARDEYARIVRFIDANRDALVDRYLNSSIRPSSILLEVRKDLIWNFDRQGMPLGPREEDARFLARHIAAAIRDYLCTDRPAKEGAMRETDPRYH